MAEATIASESDLRAIRGVGSVAFSKYGAELYAILAGDGGAASPTRPDEPPRARPCFAKRPGRAGLCHNAGAQAHVSTGGREIIIKKRLSMGLLATAFALTA